MPPRTPIDAALVHSLIRAQFPHWADLPIAPVTQGGWDNRTFRLGPTLLARLPSARRYAAQVAKEQRWLPRLAPHLPLPVPEPVALGQPGPGFPRPWSVYRWIEGEPATSANVPNLPGFATILAQFLAHLHSIPTVRAPLPGRHNFWRGGPLATYDAETRQTIAALGPQVNANAALALWTTALQSHWRQAPVWLHGDFAAGNLLCQHGRLAAVIDFGTMATGDPACDLAIAWTMLDPPARAAFRSALPLDKATWWRAQGWALWKALITLHRFPAQASAARTTLKNLRCIPPPHEQIGMVRLGHQGNPAWPPMRAPSLARVTQRRATMAQSDARLSMWRLTIGASTRDPGPGGIGGLPARPWVRRTGQKIRICANLPCARPGKCDPDLSRLDAKPPGSKTTPLAGC